MPSPMTHPKRIEKSIRELEELDVLSNFNQRDLAMRRMWLELAGKDVVIRVLPQGTLDAAAAPPKFVEVTDMIAADMISAAGYRSLEHAAQDPASRCRLATPEEAAAYHAHEEELRQAARRRIAVANAELATAHLQGILGHFVQGAPAEAPAAFVPTAASAPAPQASPSELSERMKDAGFDTIEAIAAADPAKLAKVKGIGKAKAAALIADAAEQLAAARGEQAESAD